MTPISDDSNTALDRIKEGIGKQISLDSFLFACWEHEKFIEKLPVEDRGEDWPDLPVDGNTDGLDVAAILDKLFAWSKSQTTELCFDELIDVSTMVYFVPVVVRISTQLNKLLGVLYGAERPKFDSRVAPSDPFWQAVLSASRKAFPKQSELTESYLWWEFGPEPVDDVVPGSRPPVGKFAYSARGRPSATRAPSGGMRSDRHARGGQRGSGGQRAGSEPRRGGPRQDGRRRDRNIDPRQRVSREVEAQLMKDVLEAVGKLRADKDLASVPLTPRNSFHRRLQHQMIKEEGFDSQSSGEGTERAVVVIRQGS